MSAIRDDQPASASRTPSPERQLADTARMLALDAVEAARSGDADLPIAMAHAATALWTRFLKFDAADPRWPDRDRFVLSAGQASALLYALLHLTGHAGMSLDDLRSLRQLTSPAAGHPQTGNHPAIEATAGAPGEALAAAVGMALGERMMAARFGRSLVDHRTWVLAGPNCLAAGVAQEAISFAGRLRLEKLTVLWWDSTSEGAGDLASGLEETRRFAGAGWTVRRVDGDDPHQLTAALSVAIRSRKPTLIACRAAADDPTPSLGQSWGAAEALAVRQALDWTHQPFTVPEAESVRWRAAGSRGAAARRGWLKRLARHAMRPEFDRVMAGRLPDGFHEAFAETKFDFAESRPRLATGVAATRVMEALAGAIPEMTGATTDHDEGSGSRSGRLAVGPGSFAGRVVPFGARQHAMAAAMNGLALHGGFIPHGGARLVLSDLLRPAIRSAAMMRLRVVHLLTHDGIGLGEDGATQQPVEHLASLRAMPNVHVFRPADALETAECCELALRRAEGPSLLVLSRQALPALRGDTAENRCARGGYVLAEADGARQATLIASGSEVAIALAAREALAADRIPVAVVSLPCWELFAAQPDVYRAEVLGGAARVGIEAACGFGWDRWLGQDGVFIGMAGYGASAPVDDLYRHFGITAEAIAATVRRRLVQ